MPGWRSLQEMIPELKVLKLFFSVLSTIRPLVLYANAKKKEEGGCAFELDLPVVHCCGYLQGFLETRYSRRSGP